MTRYWAQGEAPAKALGYADEWRKRCWESQGSILSNEKLWTYENANELLQRFVQNPIEGTELSFFEKFQQQLGPASAGAKKLAAEMLWLLYLFPTDTLGNTKREHIQKVWNWSGEILPMSNPWLGGALDTGIGKANPGLSNYRPQEVALIVSATCKWRRLSDAERTSNSSTWAFGNWLDTLPESKGRQFRHIWLYLMFPDDYEATSSEGQKRKIIACYKDVSGVRGELETLEQPGDSDRVRADKMLLAIRRVLEKTRSRKFSFYEPEYQAEWLERPQAMGAGAALVVATPSISPPPFEVSDPGDLFIDADEFAVLANKLRREKNLILQGPPGVGKTFIAKRLAAEVAGAEQRVRWVQFHESYSYEDFIRGYRPDGKGGFVLEDGIFFEFNQMALNGNGQPFVFVIDEINRGKLSKIFGELLICIEHDKRSVEWGVQLAYRKSLNEPRFYVAPSLFVIGLMNTADRSLAVVDYALRRRFSFHTLRPMFASDRFKDFLIARGVSDSLIKAILERVQRLNEAIESELGAGFMIGHSFFCPTPGEEPDENWYLAVVRSHIEPLLEEYWFDNRTRVRELLDLLRLP
jgi:MoxR-like ATPase